MLFNFSTYVLAVFALASSISASIHKPSKNRGCAADQDNAVEWDTGDLSGLVSLHLCPGGATDISQSISVIATSVANSGSYNWRPRRSTKSHKSFTIIIIDSTSHSVLSEDFGISGLEKGSAADGQGYNATHEAASTEVAATHEIAAPVIPEHSVVVEHPMPVVETAAPVMPEHSVVVEHPMPTIVETAAPVMPEHSVVVEHPMPVVETVAPAMPEHSVVVEHPMPTIVETAAPVMPEHSVVVEHPMPVVETVAPAMPEHSVVVEHPMPSVEAAAPVMPEHSVVVEHPMPSVEAAVPVMPEHSVAVEHSVVVEHPVLTIVETAALGHIVGLASTFTRIIIESHGNTVATAIETAVQPSLTTFIPEESTFSSEAVATEPAAVIATESTRFQGNETAIAVGTIGTNTRVNSPVFTGGATDNAGSGKVYGAIGAAAVGFVIGML